MTRAFQPASLGEALAILSERPDAVVIAGCTDLMAVDHASARQHPAVVDLLPIPELKGIFQDGDWLDVGATCTFSEILNDPQVRAHAPLLADGAATIGAWQIQNRATLGGNIANASPAGDSLPILLALGAEVVLAGPRGERTIDYDQMHVGYRKTALAKGEIIKRIRIPVAQPDAFSLFRKVGTRAAQAISKVAVAFCAKRGDSKLHNVCIGAGSVGPTPMRLRAAENACEGSVANEATATRAGQAARAEVTPIDDVRSTAEYRSYVLERVVRRMVLLAASSYSPTI